MESLLLLSIRLVRTTIKFTLIIKTLTLQNSWSDEQVNNPTRCFSIIKVESINWTMHLKELFRTEGCKLNWDKHLLAAENIPAIHQEKVDKIISVKYSKTTMTKQIVQDMEKEICCIKHRLKQITSFHQLEVRDFRMLISRRWSDLITSMTQYPMQPKCTLSQTTLKHFLGTYPLSRISRKIRASLSLWIKRVKWETRSKFYTIKLGISRCTSKVSITVNLD